MQRVDIFCGDCLEVLRTLADSSVDAVVTDPPYGLAFMGKRWDYDVPSVDVWAECLRVLKPGGHLLAFAGTRTQHRMAVRIEDAGFEIRDMIAWVYGTGFNKVGYIRGDDDQPVRDGWGGSLKPALEPITMARKPLRGTVAACVLEHGTGAINVDGCRVPMNDYDRDEYIPNRCGWKDGAEYSNSKPPRGVVTNMGNGRAARGRILNEDAVTKGRWPANLIHDGSEEVTELLSDAARFFYCAKASKADRDEGLEGFEARFSPTMGNGIGGKEHDPETATPKRNHHPTVKPTDLMRYLCRLVTPPNGTILDPFTGSGSTGKAAMLEGFQFIGIEREAEYCEIARARISKAERETMGQLNLE